MVTGVRARVLDVARIGGFDAHPHPNPLPLAGEGAGFRRARVGLSKSHLRARFQGINRLQERREPLSLLQESGEVSSMRNHSPKTR